MTWYNELTGNWATWEPGRQVEPGSVGFFDRSRCFTHYRTLADYGVVPVIATEAWPEQTRLAWSDGAIDLSLKASGQSSAGFSVLGDLDSGLKITAHREHACVLHMRDLSEWWIDDVDTVLRHLKGLLLKGEWEVDSVVVVRCTEARRGFAAISLGSKQSFEAKADGGVNLAGIADLGHVGLTLASGPSRANFLFYDFVPGSTPVFSSAIRVRRSLWDRLLPWRHDGLDLIGPDGRTYRELPESLDGQAIEARRYDPAKSVMPPGELAELTVEDLFEEVVDLRDDGDAKESPPGDGSGQHSGRVLSFPLRPPPAPAALAATGSRDGAPPVAVTTSPDGQARFALFDKGEGEYWLELSLSIAVQVPVIARLRYTTIGYQQREILVPVGGDATASSLVLLRGYNGGPWRAWMRIPSASMWSGPPELVEESVGAALNKAAVDAWELLASKDSEYGGPLIGAAMDASGKGL